MTIQMDWMFPSVNRKLSIIRNAPAPHVSQERNEGGRVPDERSGPQDQTLLPETGGQAAQPRNSRELLSGPALISRLSSLSFRVDTGMESMPYFGCMKMTMHINEALLKRVMAATGATSKTKAVDLALREVDRRVELIRIAREGLGLTSEELRSAFCPSSDPDTTPYCAEARRTYGRKSRSR